MIQAEAAIRAARGLIGTSYETLDCINLIKKVIRTCAGGDKRYTTAGTNELWNSFDSVPKYRHLIWRQSGISGAKPGMLAFMGVGTGDVSHTGSGDGAGHGHSQQQEPGWRGRNRADGEGRVERAGGAPDDCRGRGGRRQKRG